MEKKLLLKKSVEKCFFLTALLLSLGLSSFSQGDTGTILKKLSDYKEKVFQEKLFVHTDRSTYVTGEIIWFEVYCVDGSTNTLSELSKVAYVEVLDKHQVPVLQAKIALKDGTGSGSIVVPPQIQSGGFLLRAYTNWMKNFDPEFYFHQNLTLVNTVANQISPASKTEAAYDIQFFPEGGNLVSELKNKVAFRVTDNKGKGVEFTGAVVDQQNDTVLHFEPARFGIGNFYFAPNKDRRYKALLKVKSGAVVSADLPQTLTTGFVLNVVDTPGNAVKISVLTNTGQTSAFVVIHSARQVQTSRQLLLPDGKASFVVDKSGLADGISSVTLFDQNGIPVCERIYFKKPTERQLAINAKVDSPRFGRRKKVAINIDPVAEGTSSDPAKLSMAVVLIDSLYTKNQDIYSYIWMSSDLKGIVESPEYYLENSGAQVDEATDNLMLTHGWRRFKWRDVLQDKSTTFQFLPEYESHIVSARVVNRFNNKPGQNVLGFLSVPGSLFQLYSGKSMVNGNLYFNTKNFFGTRLIVAQAKKPEADSFRLDIESPFSENFASFRLPPFDISGISTRDLLRRSVSAQAQNLYRGEQLNSFVIPATDTLNFYGPARAKYMLDDYTRFPTMEEVLREYVREIDVRKKDDKFILKTITKDELDVFDIKEPVVLLDGVPQFDKGNQITRFDPLKVKKLEVIQDRYFLGPTTFDAVASFTTYKGDLGGFQLDSTYTIMDYEALQNRREFFSPVYQTSEQYASRLPDFRSLLFWVPEINTGTNEKKEISFYTSDRTGKYAVILQGISKKGRSGSKVLMFDVENDE